ncbi:hypothetical protein RR48_09238 [Papilio machaon]|uniref:Uncharacterized protein n=1 Tax=Papilio machaon TaxID=76193 RepID=A0A194RH03_PAPMA|nr:hypothetical protein RR48_09238 [Papilio machaon]
MYPRDIIRGNFTLSTRSEVIARWESPHVDTILVVRHSAPVRTKRECIAEREVACPPPQPRRAAHRPPTRPLAPPTRPLAHTQARTSLYALTNTNQRNIR